MWQLMIVFVCVCVCVCVCVHMLDEGVYINATGEQAKDVRLQWGEIPSSIGECL